MSNLRRRLQTSAIDADSDNDETDPRDRDTDDDGLEDKLEIDGTWCYVGEATGTCDAANHNLRMTSALDNDTDDDALLDGQETGLTSPGVHTDGSRFRGDLNAATRTDPMDDDTDGDGILDGTEDVNRNGRVDSSEADPLKWDSDGDGLPDGKKNFGTEQSPLWKGEDLDLDGVRDQNADGNWTETDFLANDSDVDGVLDGAEVNGTYCFKGGSCANTAHPLLPLNPDTDGEGLRDGQELAGWMVGIWYERTMETKENYSVTSNPWDDNTDSDTLTDFKEFMNGSDPWASDTDMDGISDTDEIAQKSNITGIEGTPPQIQDVQLRVELVWRANTACLLGQCVTLYTPDHLELHVAFKVTENVGIDFVEVRVTKLSGVETQKVPGNRQTSLSVDLAFGFGLFEALLTGADVNITAYDVNGNGAWGEFHQDSVAQMAVKAIAALFTSIANVIVEAVSAAFNWVVGAVSSFLEAVLRPIREYLHNFMVAASRALNNIMVGLSVGRLDVFGAGLVSLLSLVFGDLFQTVMVILMFITAIELILLVASMGMAAIVSFIYDTIGRIVIGAIIGAVVSAATGFLTQLLGPLLQSLFNPFDAVFDFVSGLFPSSKTRTTTCDWMSIGFGVASIAASLVLVYQSAVRMPELTEKQDLAKSQRGPAKRGFMLLVTETANLEAAMNAPQGSEVWSSNMELGDGELRAVGGNPPRTLVQSQEDSRALAQFSHEAERGKAQKNGEYMSAKRIDKTLMKYILLLIGSVAAGILSAIVGGMAIYSALTGGVFMPIALSLVALELAFVSDHFDKKAKDILEQDSGTAATNKLPGFMKIVKFLNTYLTEIAFILGGLSLLAGVLALAGQC